MKLHNQDKTKLVNSVFNQVHKNYDLMNDVMRLIKEHKLEIINTDFQIDCNLIFAVPKSKANTVLDTFKKNHELSIKYIKTI